MRRQIKVFILRWIFSSVGLWLVVRWFGVGHYNLGPGHIVLGFVLAGLIFSVINSLIRPLIVILSLPFIMITLGLFMVIVNGLIVYIAMLITPNIEMGFWQAVISGLILSVINYLLDLLVIGKDK